ncbi:MFS transporter [Haliangium ochraceum]|uniref:Major facilitator superfamily MFS_1 n=1 Tax=Haliangium ochraceum (strain DSM 14365 / JCM 11303 / SMP-2) TaxID=502025 RepID=D0LYT8_HALO1|nr:MFS transporter [Haliangium ochraceum]ACY14408.1 major facilitator superfamily MFS_1 [Haliangium ochraceum DSM 14365]
MLTNARNCLIASASLFIANGFVLGAWASTIPEVAARLGLSEGRLGVVLLSFAIGGIGAMAMAPMIVRRTGALRLALVTGVGFAACLLLPVIAPSWALAIAGALVFGIAHGAMDISMNAYAVSLEQRVPRPVLSRLHGTFSVGAVAGALFGGALIASPLGSLSAAALTAVAGGLVLLPALRGEHLPAPGPGAQLEGQPAPARTPRSVLVALAFVGCACLSGEGAMIDWTAKLMRELGAEPFAASVVYACFAVGMAGGRFAGDSLRTWLGDRPLLVGGCVLAGGGIGLMLALGDPVLAMPAMLLAGLGVSNVVPIVFRTAGGIGPDGAASLALVTGCGYAGLLLGPPAIAAVAEFTGLRAALVVIVLAFALAAGAGGRALQAAPIAR